jgi:DNA-binding CsgD family transcriptional regulator
MDTLVTTIDAEAPEGRRDEADDALRAERAWRDGELVAAIDAADRALAAGVDPDCRAAAVAAAAAAADGALLDAAARWRGIAETLDGTPGAWACGRAALASALAGDVAAAGRDLAEARRRTPAPAPRGLEVLLAGAEATGEAVRGDVECAARRLAALAAATVPADPLACERWDELAVAAVAAGGDDGTGRAMLGRHSDRPSLRHRLLAAWLDLRAGRLENARRAFGADDGSAVLRRNAVLAAAVAIGLARRSGDDRALEATWHRLAPVVAGADVEPLLLDAWGEMSVGAARVSPADAAFVVDAMRAAVERAGSPAWCVAVGHWWTLQRAVAVQDAAAAASSAKELAGVAADHPLADVYADAAAAWAAVLAGTVDPQSALDATVELAAAGRRWEAAELAGAAGAVCDDPAAARELLGLGRRLRGGDGVRSRSGDGALSDREREVGALVVDGLTQKEIGARLYISPKTVEQHVARLRQKLAASNRAELVAGLRARLGT